MTLHGLDEMEGEGCTVLDVENVILTGEIVERQKDENTGEWKYLVRGLALSEDEVVVVAKLSPTRKLVIITMYAE